MKQPTNFGSVVEGSLRDGNAVFALLSSPEAAKYDLHPALIHKVIKSLSPGDRTHRFVHAKLVSLLQNDIRLCGALIETQDMEQKTVEFISEHTANYYQYSLFVTALCIDYLALETNSKICRQCAFGSFGGLAAKSKGLVYQAILGPFAGRLSAGHRECALRLYEIVVRCKGVKDLAEHCSLHLKGAGFVFFVRHLPKDESTLALIHEYLVFLRHVDSRDIAQCVLALTDVADPVKLEFVVTLLAADHVDAALKRKVAKRNLIK